MTKVKYKKVDIIYEEEERIKMNNWYDDPIKDEKERRIKEMKEQLFMKKSMTKSTKKAIIITSIIFCVIIVMLVSLWRSEIELLQSNIKENVYRVVATKDIEVGETITFDNVQRIVVQDVLEIEGTVYRLNKEDESREYVKDFISEDDFIPTIRKEDERWAIGKIAKEKIYKGEILLIQRLEEVSH